MKKQKKKKESASALQNKEGEGRRLIQSVRYRKASESEASEIERALDQLLAEMIRQERAKERTSS